MTEKRLFISEYFLPDTASSGRLISELTYGLADEGMDVDVLSTQPHYDKKASRTLPRKTVQNGVTVIRPRIIQLNQSSLLRRVFDWLLFLPAVLIHLYLYRDEYDQVVFVSNPPILPPVCGF